MNWLFSKNQNQQMVASTPLQTQRLKQIKSLNTCNSNVIEESRDFEYRVPFSCGRTPSCIHITLPPQFPNEKPIVHVSPPCIHPWVDNDMKVIGSTEINTFHMHSDLGKVIQHIIKELKKNQPQFKWNYEQPSYLPPSISSSVAVGNLISTSDDYSQSSITASSSAGRDQVAAPEKTNTASDITIIMSQLEQLGRKELEEICTNPDLLLDYVHEMKSVVDIQNQRKQLVEENELIAKENISLEPVIEDLKVDLKEAFEMYKEVYNTLESKVQKQDELRKCYDHNNILTNLRISIAQAEEESEIIADNFLKGSVNLEEFLGTFSEKRKTCHLRRMKEDRFKNILIY